MKNISNRGNFNLKRSVPIIVVLSVFLSFGIGFLLYSSRNAVATYRDSKLPPGAVKIDKSKGVISVGQADTKDNFDTGTVIVKFKDILIADDALAGITTPRGTVKINKSQKLTEILERYEAKRAEGIFKNSQSPSLQRIIKFSLSTQTSKKDIHALVNEFSDQPEVEYAEPNYIMTVQVTPNDTYYSSSGSWGQTFRDLWGLQTISSESAWNISTGSGVVVAVSDTGIDYNHPDIAANIWNNPGETGLDKHHRDKRTNGIDDDGNGFIDDWEGWNFVSNNNNPFDDFGHGTHVAGTIAAVRNNNAGIVGVAPGAKVMAIKGLDQNGQGFIDILSNSIVYAANNGAKVINASWGGFGLTPKTLLDAIAFAHDTMGVTVVVAAGNDNIDIGSQDFGFTPANIRDAVTVSAFDHTDTKAFFSNFGVKVDVGAPGGGESDPSFLISEPFRSILSLRSSGANSIMTGNGSLVVGTNYLRQAGTSMASPHVAGVAALLKSAHPTWGPEEIRQALRKGSDDIGIPGFDLESGYGRLNAFNALLVTQPLSVQITSPANRLVDLNQLNITGTASGANFSLWSLEYGDGDSPLTWNLITSSATPVSEGLLASWSLDAVADGVKTIRLVARNSTGTEFEDRVVVTVDRVTIDSPHSEIIGGVRDYVITRGGENISITGTVAPARFLNYTIAIFDRNGIPLSNPDITLANGGNLEVSHGLLGTWNTTGVLQDEYKIILQANLQDGSNIQESTALGIESSLHQGWPQKLIGFGGVFANYAITDLINTADIDNNGTQDILLGFGSQVMILDHTGAMLPGWPQPIDFGKTGAIATQKSPAVGDIDGDGIPEVVTANSDGNIFVWHTNGTALIGWPKTFNTVTSISIADVNGDGTNEIIAADWFGYINVLDKNGINIPGWPVNVGFELLVTPAVADMDGDGNKEIVVIDILSSTIHLLSSNGIEMPGWPKQINLNAPGIYFSQPALGDLNNDGKLEVVAGGGDGTIYAFNLDGTTVPGWPQVTKSRPVNSPAIGDIDGDGKVEVIAGIQTVFENGSNLVNYIYAWHGDGTLLSGWPVKNDGIINSLNFGFGAVSIADVDGDGVADVIASSDIAEPFSLYAFHSDGTHVAGFPKITLTYGAFPTNVAAVSDVDGDGLLEMVWLDYNGNIYVWDLPTATANASLPWPMFAHDAQHTTANLKSGFVDNIPPIVNITSPSDGASVIGTIAVSAIATDNVGVSGVQFKLDGVNLNPEDIISPYKIDWNTATISDGIHTLSAVARDINGNLATSSNINVKVNNNGPIVTILTPANGATLPAKGNVKISVTATATNGISLIKILADLKTLQTCSKVNTCAVNWNVNNVSPGTHKITAIAQDNSPIPVIGSTSIIVNK